MRKAALGASEDSFRCKPCLLHGTTAVGDSPPALCPIVFLPPTSPSDDSLPSTASSKSSLSSKLASHHARARPWPTTATSSPPPLLFSRTPVFMHRNSLFSSPTPIGTSNITRTMLPIHTLLVLLLLQPSFSHIPRLTLTCIQGRRPSSNMYPITLSLEPPPLSCHLPNGQTACGHES